MSEKSKKNVDADSESAQVKHKLPMAEFLKGVGPNRSYEVEVRWEFSSVHDERPWSFRYPVVELFCERCDRKNFFEPPSAETFKLKEAKTEFRHYYCRNCRMFFKSYALRFSITGGKVNSYHNRAEETPILKMEKFGESPEFRIQISKSVRQLLGANLDLYQKGLICEARGLGIGAWGYYRRVVKATWTELVHLILKVAIEVNAPRETIDKIEGALKVEQFRRGVKMINGHIPDAVRIKGHNPITLLYGLISNGMKEYSDEELLARAQHIRELLTVAIDSCNQLLEKEKKSQKAVALAMKLQREFHDEKCSELENEGDNPSPIIQGDGVDCKSNIVSK